MRTHLFISHWGAIRKGGQYWATRVAVVSIRGSPFAIVSFVKPYCFARNLQNRREYAKQGDKGGEKG